MPPKFARDAGWVFAVLAVLATIGAVWIAVLDVDSHREMERFDAAPVCAVSTPPPATAACKTELPATLESVSVSKGKNKIATLRLRTVSGVPIVTDVHPELAPDPGEAAGWSSSSTR